MLNKEETHGSYPTVLDHLVDRPANRYVRWLFAAQVTGTEPSLLTPARTASFRAGHAHAGVLLVMSLLYYSYLAQTGFSAGLKLAACLSLLIGILAQSGGFFLHMLGGKTGRLSAGNMVTMLGAVLLACTTLLLAYGLLVARV
jgi:hypothetical protein